MKMVSAVLINYNGLRDLPACLESLVCQDYPELELIMVDNASGDGSTRLLEEFAADPANQERFAGGSPYLIRNSDNLGFSAALNLGIYASRGDYILSLNTDIVLEPDFVSVLSGTMEEPGVGSASGKLLRFPPRCQGGVIDSAGHIMFRNRLAENRGEELPGDTSMNRPGFIFGTCGAAALYSRSMLEDVKVEGEYFDESFFAFWEDLDMDWRAALRGWKCVYEPGALGYHRRGGTGYRKSLLVEYHNFKNRYLAIMKNDLFSGLGLNLPGILLTEILKAGALLERCPGALLSLGEVVRLIPRTLRKRRYIQSRRLVSRRETRKWFMPFGYRRWIRKNLVERASMAAKNGGQGR